MLQIAVVLNALVSGRIAKAGRDKGATAVEYGLIVALIAAVVIGAVFVLGGTVKSSFTKTNDCIANPTTAAANCK